MLVRGRTRGIQHPTVDADSFFALVPEAFAYPLRKTGKYLLLLGAAFFMVLEFVSMFGVFGLVFGLLGAGYMASFLFDVVDYSALGRKDIPRWPDLSNYYEDIFVPAFCMIGAFAVCLLPYIAVCIWAAAEMREVPAWGLALLVAGLVCAPMALLGVAMTRSAAGLNPLKIIAAIVRVPLEYATICALFALLAVVEWAAAAGLTAAVPLGSLFLRNVLSLYLAIVQMRLLGLLYYTKSDALGWFAIE
jgi:hypothetical protein